jgi:hypothetical protein
MQCNGIGRCGQRALRQRHQVFSAFKAVVRQSSSEKFYEEIDMLFETKDD